MEDLNCDFEKINTAIEKFNNTDRDEIFSYLSGNDEILAQIALLQISEIQSHREAENIVFWLTEHSSETREYCAFLINRLLKNKRHGEYFYGKNITEKILAAISDVNPKVCRKIIEILPYYSELNIIYSEIIKKSFEYIRKLEEKNKNKNYQYNTLSFRLYWCVFALGYCLNKKFAAAFKEDFIKLLLSLFEFAEYTLREKAAYLAKKLYTFDKSEALKKIISCGYNDENFFVKEILI